MVSTILSRVRFYPIFLFSCVYSLLCPNLKRTLTSSAHCSSMSDRRWSSLPSDILVTIAELVVSPHGTDLIRFSSVCKTWRSAASKVTFTPAKRQIPWLMGGRSRSFYNPSVNRFYDFSLLGGVRREAVCGSVSGCVAVVEFDLDIRLLNLNSFARSQRYRLPSLKTICADPNDGGDRDPEFKRDHFAWKLCLPFSPSVDPKGIAAVIYGPQRKLAFARLGGREWKTITSYYSTRSFYTDAVLCKGSFYIVDDCGDVFKLLGTYILRMMKVARRHVVAEHNDILRYLVESGGGLMQVCCGIERCWVFKLDERNQEWETVTNLGERALFLGNNYSVSVMANELSGCRSNCIYFTKKSTRYDIMAMYSLEDQKIEEQHICRSVSGAPPLWVSPFAFVDAIPFVNDPRSNFYGVFDGRS